MNNKLSYRTSEWPPDRRRYVKAATVAGRRGIPDPAISSRAPEVFIEVVAEYEHRAATALRSFWDDHHADIAFVEKHQYTLDKVEPPTSDIGDPKARELAERAAADREQTARQVLEKIASLNVSVRKLQAHLGSLEAAWKQLTAAMMDAYRKRYLFADQMHRLKFPSLDLRRTTAAWASLAGDYRWDSPLPPPSTTDDDDPPKEIPS